MKLIQSVLVKQNDILLVIVVMGILLILLIPFPPIILDFFLCLNISLGILLLLITLNVKRALEFSTFPSLLLLATLFRLALNVASTRLILLNGYAGSVIEAFGDFVVGGNPLVGFIIFMILVIIQFIVITKGANRISEVAARFTLDAMPGKQMSIDADLNTGAITEQQAEKRRKEVTLEAEFYGAMDGAGKFVRGDAIAGIVIIIINILGGLVLGINRGMAVTEAITTYIILTVGDGLVSQIPALLISVSTGILTTQTSSDTKLADELTLQFNRHPRMIAMTAFIVFCFGLMPGLPAIPFWGLSGVLIAWYYFLVKASAKEDETNKEQQAIAVQTEPPDEKKWLNLDRLRIELGYKLVELADSNQSPSLMDRLVMLREQLAGDIGILIPPIHIIDNMQLAPQNYRFLLEGEKLGEYSLYPNYYLAISSGAPSLPEESGDHDISGIDTFEPSFGLKAKWIDASQRQTAERAGYAVITAVSVLITHLSETLKRQAYQILRRDDVHFLLELLKIKAPKLVETSIPDLFSLAEVQQILQNLLAEKVSVLNLCRILETLSLYASKTKDINQLTELVRQNLSGTICSPYQTSAGVLAVITIDPATENTLREVLLPDPSRPQLSLSPQFLQKFIQKVSDSKQQFALPEGEPVLLVNADIRRQLKELICHSLPDLAVLSFQEVLDVPEIKCIGMVQIEA